MRILTRKKMAPTYLLPGDTLTVKVDDEVVLTEPITRAMYVDVVGSFLIEEGDDFGNGGIGGFVARD